ncbi:DUF1127 domain-containing protein [Marinomonas spartinae]|uniref:DUF1127 domain-containing protein n=1 Tax=Marinomonas spartinae TaxID=1792290 RepID=UPI0018F13FFE|nr:DUF1127 domain-containing protein [Marinomonas spartinae]MBJ7555155.1 DUF1127 domain-containing protein [Marinomonas spartinae]
MSIIALFNLAKDYLEARRTKQAFRHLDDHFLKDIGFHRENGQIRPLSGSKDVNQDTNELIQEPPGKHSSHS